MYFLFLLTGKHQGDKKQLTTFVILTSEVGAMLVLCLVSVTHTFGTK